MDLQQRAAKSSISVLWDVEGPEPQLLLHSFPDVVQQLEDVAGRVNVKVIAPRFTSLSCYLVVSHCTTLTLAAAARLTAHGSSLCSCTTHTTDQETSCRVSFSGINWPSLYSPSWMIEQAAVSLWPDPAEWSVFAAERGGSSEAAAAGPQGLSCDHPPEEERLPRWAPSTTHCFFSTVRLVCDLL